jgi:excisionase family DNA binding protein
MARRFNYRRAKIHRSYTIAETADVVGVHRLTVRRWIAGGLQAINDRRPVLIHGADLREFLYARKPKKQPCGPGEIYCVGCRAPKRPAGDMADYVPRTAARGSLRGFCPTCDRMIHRVINRASIEQLSGGLDIAFPSAE